MADERTASIFSWLNSACRSRQKAATLVRFAQMRQFLKNQASVCVVLCPACLVAYMPTRVLLYRRGQ